MKNKIYRIPDLLIPDMKTYEIDVNLIVIFDLKKNLFLNRLCFGVYANVV